MKPRTKLQKQVAALSPRLGPLTGAQREWADARLFGDKGWLCGKKVWCERCGHVFGIENPLHSQMVGEVCPQCGRTLEVEMSRRRKSVREGSMTVITVCGGFQVLRFWYFTLRARMGEPAEVWEERIKDLSPYQVNSKIMKNAGEKAVFMHCLPAFHDHKTAIGREMGEKFGRDSFEVTDEVFESPQSIVFDEAENRMHTIKAVMAATLG